MTTQRMQWVAAIAALMFVCGGRASGAVVISDFEPGGTYYGGAEAWFGYGMASSAQESNPPGGTGNWFRATPNQYYGQMTNQSWANPDVTPASFNSNSHLELDLIIAGTAPDTWFPNASTPITIEFQFGGGATGTVNKYKTVNFDSTLKNQVIHIDADYSALGGFDPTATFWNLSLETHPGYDWGWDPGNPSVVPYSTKLWIDNVQLTPEPGSLTLAALAGIALLRRGRRRGSL